VQQDNARLLATIGAADAGRKELAAEEAHAS